MVGSSGVSGEISDRVFDELLDLFTVGIVLGGRGPGILDGDLSGDPGDRLPFLSYEKINIFP